MAARNNTLRCWGILLAAMLPCALRLIACLLSMRRDGQGFLELVESWSSEPDCDILVEADVYCGDEMVLLDLTFRLTGTDR